MSSGEAVEAVIGTFDDIEKPKQESTGLAVFIRSSIGLEREWRHGPGVVYESRFTDLTPTGPEGATA